MKTEFKIYKGQIIFLDNKIKINDGIFRWHKILRTAYAIVFILAGTYFVIRFFYNHYIYLFIVGMIFIAIGIVALISGIKVNTDTGLDIRQIEKAVIEKDFVSYLNVTFYLKNRQRRKVALDYRDEDNFRKSYLDEFIQTMKNSAINTEVR
jgi:hypothetical protein